MKKVYIIHGWGFDPGSNWYPRLKKELDSKGFEVVVPEMPNTETPVIEEWMSHLKKLIQQPDENTYFVGHSIGCQTIMRYLETLDNVKVGGVLFVAGWFNLINLEDEEVKKIAEPWLKTPIGFGKVQNSIGQLQVLISKDDPYNCVEENKKVFKEKLSAEVTILENAGHFTDEKIPVILEKFLSL